MKKRTSNEEITGLAVEVMKLMPDSNIDMSIDFRSYNESDLSFSVTFFTTNEKGETIDNFSIYFYTFWELKENRNLLKRVARIAEKPELYETYKKNRNDLHKLEIQI